MAGSSGVREGLGLAAVVFLLAIAFAWRQWVERRDRDDELPDEDRTYFARKDLRRLLGSGILVLIAVGMFAGSLIDPRSNKQAGQTFVWIWSGVAGLVLMSVIVALADWLANYRYALRHRQALLESRRRALEEEARRFAARNGPDASMN